MSAETLSFLLQVCTFERYHRRYLEHRAALNARVLATAKKQAESNAVYIEINRFDEDGMTFMCDCRPVIQTHTFTQ